MWEFCSALEAEGLLGALDTALAGLVVRLAPNPSDCPGELPLVTALLSRHTHTEQHACLDLAELEPGTPVREWLGAGADSENAAGDRGPRLPAGLAETLRRCDWAVARAGEGPADRPLVLDGNHLYLQRFWQYERELAEDLTRRAAQPASPPVPLNEIRALHAHFAGFTPEAPGEPDRQAGAVAMALSSRLSVITGGPGTGKTTIVAALLAALLKREHSQRLALCAPTGKAQARLQEAVAGELDHLDVSEATREQLRKVRPATIHRLLEWAPGGFRRDRDNPLEADVVVVDEVSMASLPLMARLFRAIPAEARVVLLGDRDQLASVEIGTILNDIHEAWAGTGRVATLRKSYRFPAGSGICRLKDAVNAGEAAGAWAVLTGRDAAGVSREDAPADYGDLAYRLSCCPGLDRFREAADPAISLPEAFAALDRFRLLCAFRKGICGVETVNAAVRRLLGTKDRFAPGLPLLVTTNDYSLGLFNGDIGLCRPEGDGIRVHFPDPARPGEFRAFDPAHLPEHEAAYAMTVHKAQGSGFDRVALLLSGHEAPLLTRELLYTGITRARNQVEVWTGREAFEAAVNRPTRRASGLAERLRASGGKAPAKP